MALETLARLARATLCRAIYDQLSGVVGLKPLLLHLKQHCTAQKCKLLVLYVFHRQTSDIPDDLLHCLRRDVIQDYRWLRGWSPRQSGHLVNMQLLVGTPSMCLIAVCLPQRGMYSALCILQR